MTLEIFILLIIFQIKHFICDFPLQNNLFMLRKKDHEKWIFPLACHCGVHFLGTYLISGIYLVLIEYKYSWVVCVSLGLFDFITHFIMDRIKASPNIWGKYKFHEPQYWNSLGFDQMFHHVIGIFIIFCLSLIRIRLTKS